MPSIFTMNPTPQAAFSSFGSKNDFTSVLITLLFAGAAGGALGDGVFGDMAGLFLSFRKS